jgi:hypothetical protein
LGIAFLAEECARSFSRWRGLKMPGAAEEVQP